MKRSFFTKKKYLKINQVKLLLLFVILLASCSVQEKVLPVVYNAVCLQSKEEIDVILYKDFGKEMDDFRIQSCAIDMENDILYKMNATDIVSIYDFGKKSFIKEIEKPKETGHDNDACIIGNKMYLVGSKTSKYLTENQKLYCWDLSSNEIEQMQIEGIEPPESQAFRCLMGGCAYVDNHLLLVTQDYIADKTFGVTHNETDKLCVYDYDITTKNCKKVFETKWDAVFIQGATYINGKLYVACNIQTTEHASNYKGIEIKVIDLEQQSILEIMQIEGNFEAEGLEHFIIGKEVFLTFGISTPGLLAQIVTMKID